MSMLIGGSRLSKEKEKRKKREKEGRGAGLGGLWPQWALGGPVGLFFFFNSFLFSDFYFV
jgi:hypothetical protein